MKTLSFVIVSLLLIVTLASCEYDVATETTVYADGSLDKTIVIENRSEKTDSAAYLFNVSSWQKKIIERTKTDPVDTTGSAPIDSVKSTIVERFTSFEKKFNSVNDVNVELAVLSDTLLQVTSKFEKKFRWFYTYITYSETYHKLNKLKLNPNDYFTVEDYAFIDRLPAEGKNITKADELYLNLLHDKIYDTYGEKAIYDELFGLASIVVNTPAGLDSLKKHQNKIRDALDKNSNDDLPKRFLTVIDSFKIVADKGKYNEFERSLNAYSKKVSFMGTAEVGKYINRINLPWTVVKTNADSVSGNSLFWAPPTIRFVLKDYTMYGECRKLNWWAVIVSVLIVGFTGYLFIRKRN